MLTAYLYIRVSTDEQAVKGYSQRSQSDRLIRYCKLNHIRIAESIFEDFSAKTFNRPEWNKLFTKIKVLKHHSIIILFTHWDRFSRNITDALLMIEKLRKLGVALQAIEQPIDFSVPENKIMLAMYLASSEVENDKRGRNVKLGMRKAKLEGRWMNKAPIGYRNMITSDGQKYIAPSTSEAEIIVKAFQNIASEKMRVNEVYKLCIHDGLKCSRSSFYHLLKNPIYCGKISITEFEGEKSKIIEGTHKSIISFALFEEVQKILSNRQHTIPETKQINVNENLLLRGILLCPNCKKTLTGSSSKGKTKRYTYYHCYKGCKFRVRADYVNNQFNIVLKSLRARKIYKEHYSGLAKQFHSDNLREYSNKKLMINKDMEKLIDRSLNAQQLFTKGDIDYDDYLLIRENCKIALNNDTKQLQELAKTTGLQIGAKEQISPLDKLGFMYETSGIIMKRRIINLLFSQKVLLDVQNFKNMLPKPVKIIYGIESKRKISSSENPQDIDQEISDFIKNAILIDFEQKSQLL
ncbi:recombinase family protein [Chryseobacterium daecheongense]|uniref:recombinase family protein n=1 Tax=Chryseobacterium daecheongense TaxID=192389 RepID=UPI001FD6F894|nr:recombinase family protein [Chryseobacterium daecheongense]UOU97199.1 recombinase family protein [Chryseobacterium daecheongense]